MERQELCDSIALFGEGLDQVQIVCDKTDVGHSMHAGLLAGRVYVWDEGGAAQQRYDEYVKARRS